MAYDTYPADEPAYEPADELKIGAVDGGRCSHPKGRGVGKSYGHVVTLAWVYVQDPCKDVAQTGRCYHQHSYGEATASSIV